MRKLSQILLFFFAAIQLNGQELNCSISINSDKIPGSNKQIFTTLENVLNEFVNQKRWTNFNYKPQERINCNLTLTLLEQKGDNFKGHIQIQSSRPVYNSSYLTPVFNFKDGDFSFKYVEYETIQFNENTYESNLISVITFYVYTVLGMDADTFTLNGGTPFYTKAQEILVQAQQSGYVGWNQNDGTNTRFILIDNILSPTYSSFRNTMYEYHIKGLDVMSKDKNAKQKIAESVLALKEIYDLRSNAFLLRVFMDSKADEIVNIFSDGPRYNDSFKLKEDLMRLSPLNASKWNKIK